MTRASAIDYLKAESYKVTERRISIDEVYAAADAGKLDEVSAPARRP